MIVGSPLPPAPTTQNMDYVFQGRPFVVTNTSVIDTDTLDAVYQARPFTVQ